MLLIFSVKESTRRTTCMDFLRLMKRQYSLVPLHGRGNMNNHDVTLYIKGFFTNNKLPSDFSGWIVSHMELVNKRGWGTCAYGWEWESGRELPVPWVTLSTVAINGIRYGGKIAKIANPVGLASAMAVDLGFNIAVKYWQATQYTAKYSHLLASGLEEIYQKSHPNGKTRVIAHSLGCKLLLHAIQELPFDHRPHEVHLCGGALMEDEIAACISNLAKDHVFVYYSTVDTTLQLGFPALNNGASAIGYSGLSAEYPKVSALNVDAIFNDEWLVHRYYPWVFHKFAGLRVNELLPHEKEAFFGKPDIVKGDVEKMMEETENEETEKKIEETEKIRKTEE